VADPLNLSNGGSTVKTAAINRHVGRTLKQMRQARGYSQEALGRRADLHRTYVGAVERGERNPTLKTVDRWLRALDVTWSSFGQAIDRVRARDLPSGQSE
jgi:transcriptional regulator with XRE-family HTH domain